MRWQLSSFPKCTHHAFLSHCAEDRAAFAEPLHRKLQRNAVEAWIDQSDYYYGRDSRTALKDGILRSRHAIFLITDAMLNHSRGWCHLELGYSELIQTNLTTRGGNYCNNMLPLFFVDQTDPRLPRSVWQASRDRGRFCPAFAVRRQVDWAYSEILGYLQREQSLAANYRAECGASPKLRDDLAAIPGLQDRITKFHPSRLRIR